MPKALHGIGLIVGIINCTRLLIKGSKDDAVSKVELCLGLCARTNAVAMNAVLQLLLYYLKYLYYFIYYPEQWYVVRSFRIS